MTSRIFQAEAERAFSFLVKAGFVVADSGPSSIRYESARSFVTVAWDPRSGELNVFVGLKPDSGEANDSYSLTDLLTMEDADVDERRQPLQVADERALGGFIEKLAEHLRTYGQAALAADRMYFRRLHTFRAAQSRIYMRDMELRRARSEAESAWRRRDYPSVVRLFQAIDGDLTPAERAKLEHASKRIHHGSDEE